MTLEELCLGRAVGFNDESMFLVLLDGVFRLLQSLVVGVAGVTDAVCPMLANFCVHLKHVHIHA